MDKVCEYCAAKVVSGTLVSPYLVQFYPEGEEKKLKPIVMIRIILLSQ